MNFKGIFIHCSATEYGSALLFDSWHKARGWREIGYHFIISNGLYSGFQKERWPFSDGHIEAGRKLDDDSSFEPDEIGAHVYGFNTGYIGVCIIGNRRFTSAQYKTSKNLVLYLVDKFGLLIENVFGHYEAGKLNEKYATHKTCPNIPMDQYRSYLEGRIDEDRLHKYQQEYMYTIFK